MPERTSMAYFAWARERLDEMEAMLASLESKASQAQVESKANADRLIADLRKRRDAFRENVKKLSRAGEATVQSTKAQLESDWDHFEAQVDKYFEAVGKQIERQQATFRDAAAAQAKAWNDAVERLSNEAARMAATRRADVDAALEHMKAQAADAESRLQKLKQAGGESWSALSVALIESRKAFDKANQTAWDAFRQATSQKT